jgi:DNA processing protein
VSEAGEAALRESGVRLTEEQLPRILLGMDDLLAVEEEIERLSEEGVQVVCPGEEGYPSAIAELPHPPPVLCLRGEWRPEDLLAVAVVGTRSPSREGLALAEEVGEALARGGVTVVSGLARGIDAAAHWGALAGGGRTVAVLGSGIRVIHPTVNVPLAREIGQRGALVSELSPSARPSVRTLMARNRLQSALSKAVLVVESGEQGGSLQTAAAARRQGRLLLAVDWPTAGLTSAGTRKLLLKGALPFRGLGDVPGLIDLVRMDAPASPGRHAAGTGDGQLPLF